MKEAIHKTACIRVSERRLDYDDMDMTEDCSLSLSSLSAWIRACPLSPEKQAKDLLHRLQ